MRSTVRATPGIRRGRAYPVDWPTPGASKLITWKRCPASACSNGCARSRLAPSPVISNTGGPEPRTDVRRGRPSASTNRMAARVREGAPTRDIPPRDQRLDRLRAFIGVDRLDVDHVPHDVEVQQDAVAAEQVPRLEDDLPGLAGVVHLCDRGDGAGTLH